MEDTNSSKSTSLQSEEIEEYDSIEDNQQVIDNDDNESEEEEEEDLEIDWDNLPSDSDSEKQLYKYGDHVLVKTKKGNRLQLGVVTSNNQSGKLFRIRFYKSEIVSERAIAGDIDCDSFEIKEKVNFKQKSVKSNEISYNGLRFVKNVNCNGKRPNILVCDFSVENPYKKRRIMQHREKQRLKE
jgi:hypothetical protein